eukprot:308996_1
MSNFDLIRMISLWANPTTQKRSWGFYISTTPTEPTSSRNLTFTGLSQIQISGGETIPLTNGTAIISFADTTDPPFGDLELISDEFITSFMEDFGTKAQNIDAQDISDEKKSIDAVQQPNIAEFMKWTVKHICQWIQSLESGRYNKYIKILEKGFTEIEIEGFDLPDLLRTDLVQAPFNIKSFKDRRDLEKHFNSLRKEQSID